MSITGIPLTLLRRVQIPPVTSYSLSTTQKRYNKSDRKFGIEKLRKMQEARALKRKEAAERRREEKRKLEEEEKVGRRTGEGEKWQAKLKANKEKKKKL